MYNVGVYTLILYQINRKLDAFGGNLSRYIPEVLPRADPGIKAHQDLRGYDPHFFFVIFLFSP